jgi:hypothetical protein
MQVWRATYIIWAACVEVKGFGDWHSDDTGDYGCEDSGECETHVDIF